MTRNLIATMGIWTIPPGFQRAYWSINFVDFSGLQWQSASVNWMGAEGLQWPYLMKRSCMSGNDINKAKGQLSSSLRNPGLRCQGVSHLIPQRPPSGKYATAGKRGPVAANDLHTLEMLKGSVGGTWGILFLHLFDFLTQFRANICKHLLLLWLVLNKPNKRDSLSYQTEPRLSAKHDPDRVCILLSILRTCLPCWLRNWDRKLSLDLGTNNWQNNPTINSICCRRWCDIIQSYRIYTVLTPFSQLLFPRSRIHFHHVLQHNKLNKS